MRRVLAGLAATLVVLTGLLGMAGTASAHNVLVGSDPAANATVDTAPTQVKLTFDEPIQTGQGFNAMTLTGPGNTRWPLTDVTVDSTVISGRVGALGPAGQYELGYRILSADGHPVSGVLRFTVRAAGTGAPLPATTQTGGDTGGGIPIWVWIVGAVVLLGAGVLGALRLGSANPADRK